MSLPNPDGSTSVPCDYDRCALRFTLNFGSWRVVQGIDNRKVGDVGYLSGINIENLVKDVPEAATAARDFRASYRRSSAMIWGGAVLAIAGAGVAAANDGNTAAIAVGVGGLTTLVYGAFQHGKSFDLLSRSMWLYNKSLKR